jgi:uncharacterized membrane protein YqiK
MTGSDIIAVIILIALAIAIVVYLLHWLYRRSSKEVSFVRTGMGGEKVVLSGGALVIPIIHNVTMVGMRTMCIEIRRGGDKSLITKNRMRVELVAEFYVRVKPNEASVAIAAQSLGKRTMEPDKLRELVQGRFVDALAIVAATMSMDDMQERRGDYIRAVKGLAEDHLSQTGLELETVSLTGLDQAPLEMFNPSNAFDAEGLTALTQQIQARKKTRNDIEQETLIQIRDKNLETEKLALEIDRQSEFSRLQQELEIAAQRNEQRAAIAKDRAERDREVEEVQLRAEEAVEMVRISQQQVIDVERQLKETRLVAEIERRRREQNEIERNMTVEIETLNLQVERTVLDLTKEKEFARLEQEREIAVRRAEQRATITTEEAAAHRIAQLAQLAADEAVRAAELSQQRNLAVVRMSTEEETRLREIAKSQRLQIEEHNRDLTVMQKSTAVYTAKVEEQEAHAQAIKAIEGVSSSREVEVAERRKRIDLLLAEAAAESNAVKITTLAKAETLAAEERNKAEEFVTLAAKSRYETDAAGKLKLNEAENSRNEASRTSEVRMQLARNLDSIIRESVKPMLNIDTIKIYEVNGLPGAGQIGNGHPNGGGLPAPGPGGGGPNLAENVVNSALRYRAQMPFVDGLLEEIGMSSGEITNLGRILGDHGKKESK